MWKERKKKERIMPSLIATTSALASTTCVRTHYVRTNVLIFYSKWQGRSAIYKFVGDTVFWNTTYNKIGFALVFILILIFFGGRVNKFENFQSISILF